MAAQVHLEPPWVSMRVISISKKGHVILPGSAERGIGGGVDTGKHPEIIGEMRLVVVSTTQRQLRPRHILPVVQSSQGDLKAANPAPHFGGDSDLFSKHLGEPPLAQSYGSGAFGNTEIFFPEEIHRLIDQFRTPCAWIKMSSEKNFQRPKLLDGCRNFAQPVRERHARTNLFQPDRAFKEQIGALTEQPGEASRLNHNPNNLLHVRGIDYLISCSRTYHDSSRKAPVCGSILSAAGEIAAGQIEDNLHAARRQNTFAMVGDVRRATVP